MTCEFYYDPSSIGLTEVAEIDAGDGYDFNKVTLWRDTEGKLWAAADSGCSCPTPYENHKWPTDFTEIREERDIRPLIDQMYGCSPGELFDFVAAVRSAIRTSD